MRKKLLLTCLMATALCTAALAGNLSKTKLVSFISECQRYDGVEVVQLGRVATGAIKATVRLSAGEDPDVRDALRLISGIKRISILSYEDCDPAVRDRITRKLDRILDDSELLMETRDGDERMHIYGVVDDASGRVGDFVMHTPTSHSLICIFGSIRIDQLAKIAAQND